MKKEDNAWSSDGRSDSSRAILGGARIPQYTCDSLTGVVRCVYDPQRSDNTSVSMHDGKGAYATHCLDVTSSSVYGKETESGETDQMSFVGLTYAGDRIIAFADSKGSRVDRNGNLYWDESRGEVNKIFKTENYIAVFYNANEVLTKRADEVAQYRLEDLIWKNMDSVKTPYKLVEFLIDRIFENGVPGDIPVYGYIGYFKETKKSMNPMCLRFSVCSEDVKMSHIKVSDLCSVYGGDQYYTSYFKEYAHHLLSDDPDEIRANIESLICQRDAIQVYNPVGLPVQTEVLYAPANESD